MLESEHDLSIEHRQGSTLVHVRNFPPNKPSAPVWFDQNYLNHVATSATKTFGLLIHDGVCCTFVVVAELAKERFLHTSFVDTVQAADRALCAHAPRVESLDALRDW